MTEYIVTGTFRMAGRTQKFTKEVNANSETHAVHLVKANIGSKHKTRKHVINIEKISLAK
ncbi:MAG: 50S ribosomal protein L18Ae [Candidatus Nanoarchaeia archaeon]|nr:50S ribosomal protein L18Ae [Candidatus Nanoarchaeia archaeon]